MHATQPRGHRRCGSPPALRFALPVACALALAACTDTRPQPEVVNAPPPAQTQTQTQTAQPAPTQSPAPPAVVAPPQAAEINDKLARIFQGAVRPDAAQQEQALVGDFNGDGSQDIAVVVRPDPARLADINSEVANWIMGDPRNVVLPDPTRAVQKLSPATRVVVEPGDVLLAVIHGYGAAGWRNPEAQQTYLLRNAVGRELRVQTPQEASQVLGNKLPSTRVDLIRTERGRESGFVFWTGGKYAWLAVPPQ